MRLVEKHIIDINHSFYEEINRLCFLSKNLYNASLYIVRQHFFEHQKFIGYPELQKQLQNNKQVDYYALPAKVSQQILRLLCNNFQSFFQACKSYQNNPKKFKARPNLPAYKHKTNGRNVVPYPIDAINKRMLKDQQVKLSQTNIVVSSKNKYIQQVRLVPKYGFYTIEIVYEQNNCFFRDNDITVSFISKLANNSLVSKHFRAKMGRNLNKKIDEFKASEREKPLPSLQEELAKKLNSLMQTTLFDKEAFQDVRLAKTLLKQSKKSLEGDDLIHFNRSLLEETYRGEFSPHKTPKEINQLDSNKVAGIDVGISNLAAITSNQKDLTPILVNGRPLKSINQFYNKQRSKLMSYIGDRGTSKRLQNLTNKRNRIVANYLHQSSRYIINLLIEKRIGRLIIGKNDGWKQEVKLGKRNNQNFVSIPHREFIQQLEYKGKLAGIEVETVEESYTSKCSFLDSEKIEKREKYAGKRVSRGMFRSSDGNKLNADVNASANIIRKAIPNAFADGIEGIVVCPERVTPLKAKNG